MITGPDDKCPQDWDTTQLLAYVEGELEPTARRDVEQHVEGCPVCATELQSLRRIDSLLMEHPESFHPDEEDLYRFVSRGEDTKGKISAHLVSCEQCREDVELLREMIAEHSGISEPRPVLPKSLRRKLEGCVVSASPSTVRRLLSILDQLTRVPRRAPVLSLGTAAAILVIVAVGLSMWPSLREHWFSQSKPGQEVLVSNHERKQDQREERTAQTLSSTRPKPEKASPRDEAGKLREAGRFSGQGRVEEATPSPEVPPAMVRPTTRSETPGGTLSAPLEPTDQPGPQKAVDRRKEKLAVGSSLTESKRRESDRLAREHAKVGRSKAGTTDHATIPVLVQIEDAEGRPIPWLKVNVPPDLVQRYHVILSDSPEWGAASTEIPTTTSPSANTKLRHIHEMQMRIRVHESGDAYDIDSRLFDAVSHQEIASVAVAGVNRDDVPSTVKSSIGQLLEGK